MPNSTMDKGQYLGHLSFIEKVFEGLQWRLADSPKEGAKERAESLKGCLSVIRLESKALDTIPSADWQERCRRMEDKLAECLL